MGIKSRLSRKKILQRIVDHLGDVTHKKEVGDNDAGTTTTASPSRGPLLPDQSGNSGCPSPSTRTRDADSGEVSRVAGSGNGGKSGTEHWETTKTKVGGITAFRRTRTPITDICSLFHGWVHNLKRHVRDASQADIAELLQLTGAVLSLSVILSVIVLRTMLAIFALRVLCVMCIQMGVSIQCSVPCLLRSYSHSYQSIFVFAIPFLIHKRFGHIHSSFQSRRCQRRSVPILVGKRLHGYGCGRRN